MSRRGPTLSGSEPFGFLRQRSWEGISGCRSARLISSFGHGVVTGLINADDTVQGWGFGDTTARAQLGWTSGAWSNTLYLTTWFPTGRYQRGFNPNTGKNHYGVNLGWGVTYSEPHTKLE